MNFICFIDGVDRTDWAEQGQLKISWRQNEPDQVRLQFGDEDVLAGFRPRKRQTVAVYRGMRAPGPILFTQGTGGVVSDGTWYFRLVAYDADGFIRVSPEYAFTVAGGGGAATIIMRWAAMPGAVAVRVYGFLHGAADRWIAGSLVTATWGIDATTVAALPSETIGVKWFGGLITSPSRPGRSDWLQTNIQAAGHLIHLSNCHLTWSAPAGLTVLQALQHTLTPGPLARYGFTLNPAQVAGPALPALEFDNAPLIDVWNDIAKYAGAGVAPWLFESDPDMVLEMWAPGTKAAAWVIEEMDGHILADPEPEIHDSDSGYADYIILRCGDSSQIIKTQSWTGADAVVDGTRRYFRCDYPVPTDNYYGVWPNEIAVSGRDDISGPCFWWDSSVDPWPGLATWCWDFRHQRLAYESSTYGDIAAVAAVTIVGPGYTAQYPIEVISDAGSPTPVEALATRAACLELPAAQALADAIRAQTSAEVEEFTFSTDTDGLRPGRSHHVACSLLEVDDDSLITGVDMEQDGDERVYRTTEVKGGTFGGSPLEDWRAVASGGASGGGGATVAATPVPATGRTYADLGGSLADREPLTGWQPVYESRPKVLRATDFPGGVATVKTCRVTSDPAVAVQLRVSAWTGAAWTVLATGTAATGSDPMAAAAWEDLLIAVLDGAPHRLEVNYLDAATACGVWGYVE
jgi:hypothetical protein